MVGGFFLKVEIESLTRIGVLLFHPRARPEPKPNALLTSALPRPNDRAAFLPVFGRLGQ